MPGQGKSSCPRRRCTRTCLQLTGVWASFLRKGGSKPRLYLQVMEFLALKAGKPRPTLVVLGGITCDKCGKEIAQGDSYTKISITRKLNLPAQYEQITGCTGMSVSSTIKKQEQGIQYAKINEKDFCMTCTEKIISCLSGN